jgi:hypothetical protein
MIQDDITLVTVNDGKRYIAKPDFKDMKRVRCFGEIESISGFSTKHGPDKIFMKEMVKTEWAERTAELLLELFKQNTKAYERHLVKEREKELEVERKKHRDKWLKWNGDGWMLSEYACRYFEQCGYEMALDVLHGGSDYGGTGQEPPWEDMAGDMAAYEMELTYAGIPEGYEDQHPARECAADYFYEGMRKAAKEKTQ